MGGCYWKDRDNELKEADRHRSRVEHLVTYIETSRQAQKDRWKMSKQQTDRQQRLQANWRYDVIRVSKRRTVNNQQLDIKPHLRTISTPTTVSCNKLSPIHSPISSQGSPDSSYSSIDALGVFGEIPSQDWSENECVCDKYDRYNLSFSNKISQD